MNMSSYNCCNSNQPDWQEIATLSSLLKLIGDESRLKILCILRSGSHCVCELIEHVGLSQSLISHHLKDLKAAGVVIDKKQGLKVHYCLTERGQQMVETIFKLIS